MERPGPSRAQPPPRQGIAGRLGLAARAGTVATVGSLLVRLTVRSAEVSALFRVTVADTLPLDGTKLAAVPTASDGPCTLRTVTAAVAKPC